VIVFQADPIAILIQILSVIMAGACVGSFATAIIDRERKHQSWIKSPSGEAARSACPSCHHVLGFWDLIPLLSWVFLRGRCRYCGVAVSTFYPLTEMACVILALFFWVVVGWDCLLLILIAGLAFWLSTLFLLFNRHKPSATLIISSISCIFILVFYVLFAFMR
jgi:leader peptidase (prepilin peptidase) / N-methyltransferase